MWRYLIGHRDTIPFYFVVKCLESNSLKNFKKSIISREALVVSIPPAITCLKLTIETLKQRVKYVQSEQ